MIQPLFLIALLLLIPGCAGAQHDIDYRPTGYDINPDGVDYDVD